MMASLAEQYLNPGCVKNVKGNEWVGSDDTDERGHAVFSAASFGCRATIRTLSKKYLSGKRSVLAIIRDWAPATDTIGSIPGNPPNNPEGYAETVAEWLGRRAGQDLYLFRYDGSIDSLATLLELCRCIEQFEAGKRWVKMSSWHAGLSMYYRDFVEKKG